MRENDLRVIKTRRAIRETFMELLAERGLAKVTVTELARRACIAKGTFYLHYRDVPDLYERLLKDSIAQTFTKLDRCSEALSDPWAFMDRYQAAVETKSHDEGLLLRYSDPRLYQRQIIEALSENVYREGTLERSEVNDLALCAFFGAFLAMAPTNYRTRRQEMGTVLLTLSQALFPQAATRT